MPLFTAWATTAAGGVKSRLYRDRAADVINVDECYPANAGTVHDGSARPLSGYFANLAAAQVVYSFATALTQQVDYCACKLASNLAFGADGSEHGSTNVTLNKRLRIPAGNYWFADDTWLIRNLASGVIYGDGKLATVLKGNGIILGFDGLWYSEISDLAIECQTTAADAALDIDGNVSGHPYATRGVQGNTLRNLLIDGGNSTTAFSMCRQGGAGAQGSENLYLNVHLSSASFACYSQSGFNALANTFMGGNVQTYSRNGIYVTGGTIAVINTGFQSTYGYQQIENDGWDINVGSSGAYEGCLVYGCRTESLRFLNNDGGVTVDIRGCAQNMAVSGWVALTAYGPVAASYKAIVELDPVTGLASKNLWVATTPGTTGAGEPTWSVASSPITDGSVVWTYTAFNAIRNLYGSVERKGLRLTAGAIDAPGMTLAITTTASMALDYFHEIVLCDATAGAITVTMPDPGGSGADRGRQITIKKTDTSANTVTISGGAANMESGATIVIAGGSRGYRTVVYADGTGGTRVWLVIATG